MAEHTAYSSEFYEPPLRAHIAQAAEVLNRFLGGARPACGLILGSGLNFYADTLEHARVLPFADVPHVAVSSAEGHKGRFVLGTAPGTETLVLAMQGRIHGYEGKTAQQVAFPVWVMQACGIDTLVTTNAVGAINPAFPVGSFCVMTDHINFTGRNPVVGMEPHYMAERFVPMLNAYDPDMRAAILAAAQKTGVTVNQGVYLGLLGPSFETPAEIRMFASWGADTVAMSLVEEVIAARHMGMRVAGLSLVSNMACGVAGGDPTSEEVIEVGKSVEPNFSALMNEFFAHGI